MRIALASSFIALSIAASLLVLSGCGGADIPEAPPGTPMNPPQEDPAFAEMMAETPTPTATATASADDKAAADKAAADKAAADKAAADKAAADAKAADDAKKKGKGAKTKTPPKDGATPPKDGPAPKDQPKPSK